MASNVESGKRRQPPRDAEPMTRAKDSGAGAQVSRTRTNDNDDIRLEVSPGQDIALADNAATGPGQKKSRADDMTIRVLESTDILRSGEGACERRPVAACSTSSQGRVPDDHGNDPVSDNADDISAKLMLAELRNTAAQLKDKATRVDR
ncbi:unnamed protein product, partial [Amoebophrya sp. A25]|eukprot:GSA25T00001106001.1